MKTLLLARHGTSEEKREGENDFDRKLTATGKRESEFTGKRLRRMNLIPGIIISSPAPRALKTANIISKKIKYEGEKIRTEIVLYTGNIPQVLNVVRQISNIKKVVMLCGHNPQLEKIFSSLCGVKAKEIRKGDIVGISFTADDWKNVKNNTGKYIFTITQNKNSKPFDMKPNKTKNQRKELQAQVSDLIHAFVNSKTRTVSKKISKAVKEASKLIAKAIYKTLNEQPKAKMQTVKRKVVKRNTVKKVIGVIAKPVAKKNPVKKSIRPKIVSKNIFPSMNNTLEKISVVESNPLHA
ncbi:MAG: histidine phosphatase family protein [Bacteroidia bacterium]|nr:histidine phosphatase family protein [Bacteroidia bacterium]